MEAGYIARLPAVVAIYLLHTDKNSTRGLSLTCRSEFSGGYSCASAVRNSAVVPLLASIVISICEVCMETGCV